MKSILVPVDFSPHTGISCQYALVIANATGAKIILFHSFFDQLFFSDGGFNTGFESGIMLTDEIILDFHKQKESKLKELAEELNSSILQADKSNIKVSYQMGSGDPEVQILQAIQQLEPELIIMGSGGMGKKRLLSGSVARRIMNSTEIPVIAVPDVDEVPSIKNVVYMTNFDPGDHEAIAEIDTILSPFQVNIFCLHLSDDNENTISKQKISNLANNQMLKNLEGRISFHLLDAENQQESLRVFMDEQKIDLISFIPHKRNILKNIVFHGLTKEDLFLIRIPILAIKPAHSPLI
jgi:nucleotide-binding universal stress UspA family protein